tara:strand:- start:28408 stop:29178 length:771 start_codon:yes stop_codon:yes gene_type:complete
MIGFFRKIRLQLMVSQAKSKYLKYAIGEITLVVIGILIALSINNWNERRKTRNEEQVYLLGLRDEFQFNQQALLKASRINETNLRHALELIKYTGPGTPQLTESQFDSLLYGSIVNEVQFLPSPGVLNEITNSGKLGNFSDVELKKALASWESILSRVRFQEQEEVQRTRLGILNFLSDKVNERRGSYAKYGAVVGFGPRKFKGNNQNVLQLEEFENKLLEFIFTNTFLRDNYYPQLRERIDLILSLINQNIDPSS